MIDPSADDDPRARLAAALDALARAVRDRQPPAATARALRAMVERLEAGDGR